MSKLLNYINQLQQRFCFDFTLDDVVRDLGVTRKHAIESLHKLTKSGDVISPAKGLYVIVPLKDRDIGCIDEHILVPIIMKHHGADYYVALLTAGAYHGATHQRVFIYQIVCNKRIRKELLFGHRKIQVTYKQSLDGLPIENKMILGNEFKLASPELVAYDIFKYRNKSGGINHIATVLFELLEAIRPQKLIQLAKTIGENAWLQRMGYILEQLDSDEPERQQRIINAIDKYLQKQKTIFIPLAQELPVRGKPRIKKWKIVANCTVESDL